jgi:hypothetical protein
MVGEIVELRPGGGGAGAGGGRGRGEVRGEGRMRGRHGYRRTRSRCKLVGKKDGVTERRWMAGCPSAAKKANNAASFPKRARCA